jgi:hypothetical protein
VLPMIEQPDAASVLTSTRCEAGRFTVWQGVIQ